MPLAEVATRWTLTACARAFSSLARSPVGSDVALGAARGTGGAGESERGHQGTEVEGDPLALEKGVGEAEAAPRGDELIEPIDQRGGEEADRRVDVQHRVGGVADGAQLDLRQPADPERQVVVEHPSTAPAAAPARRRSRCWRSPYAYIGGKDGSIARRAAASPERSRRRVRLGDDHADRTAAVSWALGERAGGSRALAAPQAAHATTMARICCDSPRSSLFRWSPPAAHATRIEDEARTSAVRLRAAARSTSSGVSSSRLAMTAAESLSASSEAGKAAFGTATTLSPAAAAERMPFDESSTATHLSARNRAPPPRQDRRRVPACRRPPLRRRR